MQRNNDSERRDPLADLPSSEPVEDLRLTSVPSPLARRPTGRKGAIRPSEKRRRRRKLTVTFKDPSIPDRLRDLARKWGCVAPDGRSPNTSAVVEYLIRSILEAAEVGELKPPQE